MAIRHASFGVCEARMPYNRGDAYVITPVPCAARASTYSFESNETKQQQNWTKTSSNYFLPKKKINNFSDNEWSGAQQWIIGSSEIFKPIIKFVLRLCIWRTFYFLCRHLELHNTQYYFCFLFGRFEISIVSLKLFATLALHGKQWKTQKETCAVQVPCAKWTRKKTRRIQYYIERVSEGNCGVLRFKNSKCSASIAQILSKRQMVSSGYGTAICYAFISSTRWLRWYSCL